MVSRISILRLLLNITLFFSPLPYQSCWILEDFLADHNSVDFESCNYYDFSDDESENSGPGDNNMVPAEKRIIGSSLSDIYYGGSTEWDDDILGGFADEVLGAAPVHWLTDPGKEELQVNYIAVSTFPYVRALSPICTCWLRKLDALLKLLAADSVFLGSTAMRPAIVLSTPTAPSLSRFPHGLVALRKGWGSMMAQEQIMDHERPIKRPRSD